MERDDNAQLVTRLAQAVGDLPAQQREIFVAIRHGSATYAELAARLGISVEKVQHQFAAALVALVRAADGE